MKAILFTILLLSAMPTVFAGEKKQAMSDPHVFAVLDKETGEWKPTNVGDGIWVIKFYDEQTKKTCIVFYSLGGFNTTSSTMQCF